MNRLAAGGVVGAQGGNRIASNRTHFAILQRIKHRVLQLGNRFFTIMIAVIMRVDDVLDIFRFFPKGRKCVQNIRAGIDQQTIVDQQRGIATKSVPIPMLGNVPIGGARA